MLSSNAKACPPGSLPSRRTSNRHRKQGKGRMDQHTNGAAQSSPAGQFEEIVDES